MVEERKSIDNGVDVLVSTYPRLTPLLDKGELFLTNLKWIVVDEIDTLYEMGRLSAIVERLLIKSEELKEERNIKIILSGTTNSQELQGYLKGKLGDLVEIVDKNTHFNLQNIRHEFIHCP
jgi:superfamily II DNA/RNA helicase